MNDSEDRTIILPPRALPLDSCVTIFVGLPPYKTEFNIHEDLLKSFSEFFKFALNPSFKEGQTKVVDLPHEDPDLFRCIEEWLYTGRLLLGYFTQPYSVRVENEEEEESEEYSDELDKEDRCCDRINCLLGLWILADFLQMPCLQNKVIVEIIKQCCDYRDSTGTLPRTFYLDFVYENTVENSPLRSLAIGLATAEAHLAAREPAVCKADGDFTLAIIKDSPEIYRVHLQGGTSAGHTVSRG